MEREGIQHLTNSAVGLHEQPLNAMAVAQSGEPTAIRDKPVIVNEPIEQIQVDNLDKPVRGRKRKNLNDTYRVSVEKVSKNTYAVRIRWKREDGSDDPGVVVNRLTDSVAKEIKRSKKRYEQFKKQTIENWKSGTIRQSQQVGANTLGVV
jgi:hypothetical protein